MYILQVTCGEDPFHPHGMWCLIKHWDFIVLLSLPEGRILCSKLRKFYVYITLYRQNGALTFNIFMEDSENAFLRWCAEGHLKTKSNSGRQQLRGVSGK